MTAAILPMIALYGINIEKRVCLMSVRVGLDGRKTS